MTSARLIVSVTCPTRFCPSWGLDASHLSPGCCGRGSEAQGEGPGRLGTTWAFVFGGRGTPGLDLTRQWPVCSEALPPQKCFSPLSRATSRVWVFHGTLTGACCVPVPRLPLQGAVGRMAASLGAGSQVLPAGTRWHCLPIAVPTEDPG